jgi:AcrR family transcriptional regulator
MSRGAKAHSDGRGPAGALSLTGNGAAGGLKLARNGHRPPRVSPEGPHGSAHERVIEIQRARILTAMAEVSAERGAGNVTVAHVVERAGVSRRTFYELFLDREDCFLAAFDEALARAGRCIRSSCDPDASSWVERVRGALVALLSFLEAERGAGLLLIVGSLGAGKNALARRQDGIAQMIDFIDEGRIESKKGAELPPLTAEGIVGGALAVLHARILEEPPVPLLGLTGPLMGMIVLSYLGPAAARKELARPAPKSPPSIRKAARNPLGELEMRLTYRTVRVLMAIAAHPGSSNRLIADRAEVTDQGQMSKLLARLQENGLIENTGGGATRGEPNAWTLTDRGWQVQGAIAEQTPSGQA